MNIEEYMTTRVNDQIKWYSEKSGDAQKKYKRLQTIEIIFAAAIPLLSGYTTKCNIIAVIVGILGAVITTIESVSKLNNYHETWIQYRTTCELLKYHRYLYLTKSHPYNDSEETIDNIFVRNIENIISSENDQWKAYASDESFKTDNSN